MFAKLINLITHNPAKKKFYTSLSVSISFAVVVSFLYMFGLFTKPQYVVSDYFRNTLTIKPKKTDIVYLLITDATIIEADELDGIQWPWPRQSYIEAIRFLKSAGARSIVFDMTFSETSREGKEDDEAFAKSIKEGKAILSYLSTNVKGNTSESKMQHNRELIAGNALDVSLLNFKGRIGEYNYFRPPVGVLSVAAESMGDVKFLADADGVGRKVALLIKSGDKYYPSLALVVASKILGLDEVILTGRQIILRGKGGERNIPVDENGMATLKFYGDSAVYEKHLLLRLIKSQVKIDEGGKPYYDPALFKDKVVLIASDATDLKDLRPNPFNKKNDPGVHYHGTAIDNILRGEFLKEYYEPRYVLPMLFLLSALVGAAAGNLTAYLGFLFTAALLALDFALGAYLYRYHDMLVDSSAMSVNIAGSYLLTTVMNYIAESKQRMFITNAFGQYLSPKVVERLVRDPSRLKLGGERRIMTAFFSDIAGFSQISERLEPEELVSLLNDYLTEMCDVIGKYEGTVDKFEGDAIMAFWGAPIDAEEHGLLACKAALEMQERLVAMRGRLEKEGRDALHVRMGLNSGPMVAGNMGSRTRMDYTIMGDSVNLASRLEGANKFYGTGIMISEFTYEFVKSEVSVRELDMIRVVGKKEPVRIYELLKGSKKIDENIKKGVTLFTESLGFYREKKFEKAMGNFQRVFDYIPDDPPSTIFIQRCEDFLKNPPKAEWDSVFEPTSKG